MTIEGAGAVVAIILGAFALAALGGALVWRFRSGGEKEAITSYKNAVDAYKEELAAANSRGDRLEVKVQALEATNQSQGEQITMLSRMVTGVEAISNLELKLDSQFRGVHEHLNKNLAAIQAVGGTDA